jgi:Tfp pilus assembly protein PilF
MRESEAMIRSIMTRRGPSAPALELLGIIRLAADDATEAKRLFEQAVYLEPARSASLLQLAMLSERANDLQRASTYWERARRAAAHVAQEPTR